MNTELVVLRWLHILPGVFWVGSLWFMVLLLDPTLRRLGPQFQGPVMGALGRLTVPVFTAAGTLTIVVGLVLVTRTPGRGFDQLFTNSWGWAIGIGFVTAVAALVGGVLTGLTLRQMGALAASAGGGAPPAGMAALGARLRMLSRSSAALTLIAVGTMAAARFS